MKTSSARVGVTIAVYCLAECAAVVTGLADKPLLADDAFYYFQIARNAALGHGFSFDGLAPTNGFHPLFAWLLVPIFWLGHASAWLPVRAAQLLLVFIAAAGARVLFAIGREVASPRAGELMVAVYLLSPFAWMVPLRGCEGPLSVLFIGMGVLTLARFQPGELKRAAWLGVIVGAAILARTENLLFFVIVLVALALRTRSARALVLFAGTALAVVSPWIVWNLGRLGTVVQVSGAAKIALDLYGRLPVIHGVGDVLRNCVRVIEQACRFVVGEEWIPIEKGRWLAGALASVGLLALLGLMGRRFSKKLVPLYAFAALHVLYYAAIQRAYYDWYVLPLVFAGAAFLGERLAALRPAAVAATLGCLTVIGALTCAALLRARGTERYFPERWASAYLLPVRDLPAGARVGFWNAGRVGYFAAFDAPQVSIVNLDCVVNNRAFAAYRRGEYGAYLLTAIDWIAEPPVTLFRFLGARGAADFARRHLVALRGSRTLFRVMTERTDVPNRPPDQSAY